jgi:predicted PurR-regulated permease PerM
MEQLDPSRLVVPISSARPSAHEIASWLLAGVGLLLVFRLHLLPALLAGLLVYELVHIVAPVLHKKLFGERAKLIAVALLSALVVGLVTLAIVGAVAFFRSDAGSLPALLGQMAEIIESSRPTLPLWAAERLPANADELKDAMVRWLRANAGDLQLMGKEAGRVFVHVLIGMVIGAMVSLHEARSTHDHRPLARALTERATRLGNAFRRVVFAQVRISALNTLFTGIYLAVLLPLLGVDLPFTKTLIAVTFIAGLLPVVGNLISNTVIVIVSLSHSLPVAAGSLAFLVVIHKLEYFLNARIVGTRIDSRAWEVLLAMVTMEAAFGIAGVIAAPIYYAYLKDELAARGVI